MRPLNILLTNENRGFGGAELHTLQLAKALAEKGHNVVLAVRRRSWLASRKVMFPVITLPMANEIDPVSVIALRFIIKRHRIHLIHAHATRDLVLANLARKGLKPRPRLFKTEHTFLGLHRSKLCDRSYQDADRIVCVSQALLDQVRSALYLEPNRLVVVYNGIDTQRINPSYKPHPKLRKTRYNRPWIGVVSSLIPGKGQEDFLKAAAQLLIRPNLVIAGDGPRKEYLQGLAEELKLKVWFPGFVKDPISILAGLQVAVVPSHKETFSLVSLEAMALGKPLIATAVGGIPEVVDDGITGTLVSPGNPSEMAKAITAYLFTPNLAARHGKAARKKAHTQFSHSLMVARLEKLYAQ